MDIQNLAVLTNGLSKKNKGAVRQPLTGIGKRGQIVEGTISKVSNRVSIRFNGIEVSVPGSAVSNARAGETRKFQIKDISEDSIVLKEAGARVEAKAVATGTTDKTDTGTYSFAECIEKSSDVMVAKEDAAQKIALVNGDEYAALEEEEGSLTDKSQEYLERAVEKMKARNEWTEQKLEERKETNEKVQEMMKKIQSQGFLNQKSEGQLRAQM